MIRIFIAYSTKDLGFKEEIRKRLRPLQRAQKIDIWDNYNIEAGKDWDADIRQKLEQSDLILLLLSPDALDSDYFYEVEAPIALRRHAAGQSVALGILLRPCSFRHTPFELGKYELLPKKGYPVVDSRWHNPDEAYLSIFEEIDAIVERLEKDKYQAEKSAQLARETDQKMAAKMDELIQKRAAAAKSQEIKEPLFDVILIDSGPNKLQTLKEIKNLLLIGLKEAHDITNDTPRNLLRKISKEEAERATKVVSQYGAIVKIMPVGDYF